MPAEGFPRAFCVFGVGRGIRTRKLAELDKSGAGGGEKSIAFDN